MNPVPVRSRVRISSSRCTDACFSPGIFRSVRASGRAMRISGGFPARSGANSYVQSRCARYVQCGRGLLQGSGAPIGERGRSCRAVSPGRRCSGSVEQADAPSRREPNRQSGRGTGRLANEKRSRARSQGSGYCGRHLALDRWAHDGASRAAGRGCGPGWEWGRDRRASFGCALA